MTEGVIRRLWSNGALVLGLTALGALLVAPTVAAAVTAPGYNVGVAPEASTELAANGSYFAPTLSPGQTYIGKILLANGNGNAVPLVIYPVEGVTSPGSGGSAYTNLGQPTVGPAKWITIVDPNRTMAAQTRGVVQFSVTVPAGTAPGDHLAGVAIQGIQPSTQQHGAIQVKIVTRSVIAVLVKVPGKTNFNVQLGTPTIKKGTYNIGEVSIPVTDTGNILGQPVLTVQLKNSSGYDKTLTRALGTMLPGDTVAITTYWPDQLQGSYQVTVCAHGAGIPTTVCSQATSSVAGSATKTPQNQTGPFPTTSSSSFPVIPVVLGGVLGGIVVLGGGIFLGLRFARKRLLASVQAAIDSSKDPD